MKAELLTLTETTDGFATAVVARGPGSGINRWQARAVNAAAAAEYGLREVVVDFPDARDPEHLRELAEEHLARVSDPANFQEVSIRVAGAAAPLRIGQRVRVSDGDLGFTTAGAITSLDVDGDEVTITLGGVPVDLLDVVNRREEAERRQVALGLPAPDQVDVQATPTGIIVYARAGVASRAVGLEVHVSTSNGFTPDASTRAARGPQTRFVIDGLPIGVRQFVRVRAYDERGNYSPFTQQVSAVPQGVGGPELVAGTIELTNAERPGAALSVRTSGGSEVLRLGNITGKSGVPAGTQYGLWGVAGAGVFIEGMPRVVYTVNEAWAWSNILASPVAANTAVNFAQTRPAITLPSPVTVPDGYRLRALAIPRTLWASRGVPGNPTAYDVFPSAWELRAEVRRAGAGTWTLSPHLDAAGTTYDQVRAYGTGFLYCLTGAATGQTLGVQAQVTIMLILVPQGASA